MESNASTKRFHTPECSTSLQAELSSSTTPMRGGRPIHSPSYYSGPLDVKRATLIDDLFMAVREVPFPTFLSSTMPQCHQATFDTVWKALRDGGEINFQGQWSRLAPVLGNQEEMQEEEDGEEGMQVQEEEENNIFLSSEKNICKPPAQISEVTPFPSDVEAVSKGGIAHHSQKPTSLSEKIMYRPLVQIFEKMSMVASFPLEVKAISTGDIPPRGQKPTTSKPDGFLALPSTHPKTKYAWEDIVQAWEFKKSNALTSQFDNRSKVVWSGHQILRTDPRRLWTTGLTVEKANARVWYFDRMVVLVSEPFNILKDPMTLIQFWVSLFSLPNPSFDPTMSLKRAKSDNRIYYAIQAGGRTLYTREVISDFKANAMIGRATRAWSAHQRESDDKEEDGKVYVVRAIWGPVDGVHEKDIRQRLREDIRSKALTPKEKQEDLEAFKEYFLNHLPELSGPVLSDTHPLSLTLPESLHNARALPLRLEDAKDPSFLLGTQTPTSNPEFWAPPPPHLPKKIVQRVHYRDVFLGRPYSLTELRSAGDIFQALMGCVKGLKLMSKYGYVHRDISPGNLFWDKSCKTGQLGDLEYMRHMSDPPKDNVKTGTLQFMACEILTEGPLHLKSKMNRREGISREQAVKVFSSSPQSEPPPFHPLHDIESMWWVALWILISRVPEPTVQSALGEELQKRVDATRDLFVELFPSQPSPKRNNFFRDDGSLVQRANTCINPKLSTAEVGLKTALGALDLMREDLVEMFKSKAENKSLSADPHQVALEAFEVCHQSLGMYTLVLLTDVKRNPETPDRKSKRPRVVQA
ncbi:uncharacterized protein EI90DRAFT_3293739 [Cantharellus anzutake]|uniref:uncharacterized protein n=1 Tax=Cantharellus anzutake TaxID=1750568 RepID=UPI001907EF36|nr:uncharacterized protein EI90DRAFT_3293739 [Cantharellus anzutake]KAF8316227.1 hypothetical protein EI90DRAFT_3293739 [Cantharellus anzutake]